MSNSFIEKSFPRHYFAEAQLLYAGLCTAHSDCDSSREKQTRQSIFSSIPECVEPDLSPVLSAVEKGLAMGDYWLYKLLNVKRTIFPGGSKDLLA